MPHINHRNALPFAIQRESALFIRVNLRETRKSWIPVFLCLLILLSASTLFASTSSYNLQLKTPNLAVYAESPLNNAQNTTFQRVDSKIDDMQMELGLYVDRPASFYLVKDHVSYQQLALGKAHIVEFSDAFYSGGEQKIYIRPQAEIADNYIKVLLHEYIHWYLETIFEHTPLWFHEGMATQYSGQMGFERYVYFLQQSFLGQRSDLFRMSYAYPAKKEDWQIFYLSSAMAVRFMRDRKTKEWKRFWDNVSATKRKGEKAVFSDCFAFSYRTTLYDFHQQFATYTKSLRYQYLFWGFNSLLALLLPVVLIIGYSVRRKRMSRLPDLPEVIEEEMEEMDSI